MSFATHWLDIIKKDIVTKHQVEQLQIVVDEMVLGDKYNFEEWLELIVKLPLRWLKYKKIGDNKFELKYFPPDPDEALVVKLIDVFLEAFDKQAYFTVNKYVYTVGEDNIGYYKDVPNITYYNFNEIKMEMRYLLLRGYSKMMLEKESIIKDNVKVYHLHVGVDSLENMLKSGYLQLEYC